MSGVNLRKSVQLVEWNSPLSLKIVTITQTLFLESKIYCLDLACSSQVTNEAFSCIYMLTCVIDEGLVCRCVLQRCQGDYIVIISHTLESRTQGGMTLVNVAQLEGTHQ